MGIRALVVDDHPIVRAGLRSLVAKQVATVAEAEGLEQAVHLAGELLPDLVIIGLTMMQADGIEITRRVLQVSPRSKVVALSGRSHRYLVTGALRAGAKAYLLNNCAAEELQAAIRTVLDKKVYLSPHIADILVDQLVSRTSPRQPRVPKALSPREREVLQLLAEGKTSKEMATTLALGIKTIDTHRQQIMDKLGIRSIAALTKYAVREGLTSLET